MDSSQDFQSLQESIQKALVSTVKTVNRVSSRDLEFQALANRDISARLDETRARLLGITNKLLKASVQTGRDKAPKLGGIEDIETDWTSIVDVLDSNFAKSDLAVDEFYWQLKKNKVNASANIGEASSGATSQAKSQPTPKEIRQAAKIPKPQENFEKKYDTFAVGPWKPVLTRKPHARIPLEQSLVTAAKDGEEGRLQYDHDHFLPVCTTHGQVSTSKIPKKRPLRNRQIKSAGRLIYDDSIRYKHPYETEILKMQYPDAVYERAEPIMYQPIESTTAKWVDTVEDFRLMLKELKKASEIAIDLEHHDYRTYYGLTSLMQISTRERDWVVDTLVPWRHQLEALNDVFANPRIVKVLHGAHMDVIWLQRDLGLYLVGVFDTFFACQALNYFKKSLAALLKKYAQFDADKKYQLADWRIRPLTDEMLAYAQADTHFLLYVYDMMRNELVERSDRSNPDADLIGMVLQNSQKQSLERYEYPTHDHSTGEGPGGWLNNILKTPLMLNGEQFAAFKAIWKWRDGECRKADESTMYILSHSLVRNIAEILPPDLKALISILPKPLRVPQDSLNRLLEDIQVACAEGRAGPTLRNFLQDHQRRFAEGSGPTPGSKNMTRNGTPLDPEGSKPAPTLARSQLFGDVPIGLAPSDRGPNKAPEFIPFRWQTLPREELPDPAAFDPAAEKESVKDSALAASGGVETEATREVELAFNLKGRQKRKWDETKAAVEENDDEAEDGEIVSEAESVPQGSSSPAAKTDPGGGLVGDDEIDVEGSDDSAAEKAAETKRRKLLKKQRHKTSRKAKVAARKQQGDQHSHQQPLASSGGSEEVAGAPFDYTQVPSVLHAPRDTQAGARGPNPKAADPFNPYSKPEEGPRGARKAPHLPGGKSATFKK